MKACKYLLALYPHPDLCFRINEERKQFAHNYQLPEHGVRNCRLTLVTFTQFETNENHLIQSMQLVLKNLRPFKVELRGFGTYPSHTIFINVTSKVPIQIFLREVRKKTQRLMQFDKENTPHFIMEPVINIANKLKPWQYEKGWLEYSHKDFTEKFIADKIYLLRKPEHEFNYKQIATIELGNKTTPQKVEQAQLF